MLDTQPLIPNITRQFAVEVFTEGGCAASPGSIKTQFLDRGPQRWVPVAEIQRLTDPGDRVTTRQAEDAGDLVGQELTDQRAAVTTDLHPADTGNVVGLQEMRLTKRDLVRLGQRHQITQLLRLLGSFPLC